MMTATESAVDLGTIAAWGTGGFSAGAGLYLFRWFFEWLGGRVDKKEEAVAAGQARNDAVNQHLIETMQGQMVGMREEIDKLWLELSHCREEHAVAKAEVMQLRAMVQGYGSVREEAARIIAADHADRKGGASND